MTRRRAWVSLAATVIVAMSAVLWADSAPTAAAADDYQEVAAADDFFDGPIVRVAVGTEVEWTNTGRNPHTVTADDGSFDSGDMQPGDTFEFTFDEPGVYPYYCIYHGAPGGVGMAGIIVVGDVPLPGGGESGVGPGREPVPDGPGATIRVPEDQPTIQDAVNAAAPGDLVLIGPGTYHEAVLVLTPYLTIRGVDRNTVILDGHYMLPNGIHAVEADGVVVENLTARHYVANGIYWTDVNGYRASYVSAYANGDYGVYAFNSTWGRFEHSYAAGNPDSGFYIGQCRPCHAVITDVLAENNGLGYSGTNASGDISIINSEWRDNWGGIGPNTLDSELLPPQGDALIAGNYVHDNNNRSAPSKSWGIAAYGLGIILPGTLGNRVEGNLIEDHVAYGIASTPMIDANLYLGADNEVRANLVRRSGLADLAYGLAGQGGDCFAENSFSTSMPPLIEQQFACDAGPTKSRAGGGAMAVTNHLLANFAAALAGSVVPGDWRTWPDGPSQPSMPDPDADPVLAVPETAVPGSADVRPLSAIESVDDGHTITPEVTLVGIPLTTNPAALLIGLYGYVFPLVLLVAWVTLALWDLARREDLSGRTRVLWAAGVLVVPIIGPLVYLFASGSQIPRGMRWMVTLGGLLIYAVLIGLGVALS